MAGQLYSRLAKVEAATFGWFGLSAGVFAQGQAVRTVGTMVKSKTVDMPCN